MVWVSETDKHIDCHPGSSGRIIATSLGFGHCSIYGRIQKELSAIHSLTGSVPCVGWHGEQGKLAPVKGIPQEQKRRFGGPLKVAFPLQSRFEGASSGHDRAILGPALCHHVQPCTTKTCATVRRPMRVGMDVIEQTLNRCWREPMYRFLRNYDHGPHEHEEV